jgi:hypothetical protein
VRVEKEAGVTHKIDRQPFADSVTHGILRETYLACFLLCGLTIFLFIKHLTRQGSLIILF